MFTNALVKPTKLLLSLSAAALISACSDIPHDEDSLYIHGFIAPLGDSPLSQLEAGEIMTISLSKGDNIISEKNIKATDHWPTAYKLEFHPPQLEALDDENTDESELKISITITSDDAKASLIYQNPIELDSPKLFGTDYNLLVTPYSVERSTDNEAYNKLFKTFSCEGLEFKAAMNMNFIVVQDDNEMIIPRSARAPEPVYIINNTRFQFPEGQTFTYQQGNKEVQCELSATDFQPWQEAQVLVEEAREKQMAADKKASANKNDSK